MSHNPPVAAAPAFELVGRDAELDELREFTRRLRDGPGAVLVRGEAGMGKTLLWRAAVAAAEAEGLRVLVARCAAAEMPVPLGTLADLVEPVFDEVAGVLAARILVAGSRGRLDEARRLGADGLRLVGQYHDVVNALRVRWALGHVELARGDGVAAGQTLEGLPDALEAFGIEEPGWQPVLPDVVEALVGLGSLDEAEPVLRQLEAQAAALGHKWAAPAALRCRALLLLARERADEAAGALFAPPPPSRISASRSTGRARFSSREPRCDGQVNGAVPPMCCTGRSTSSGRFRRLPGWSAPTTSSGGRARGRVVTGSSRTRSAGSRHLSPRA